MVGDRLVVRQPYFVMIPVTRTRTVQVDGQTKSENYTAYRSTTSFQEYVVSGPRFQLYDVAGNKMDPSAAQQRLNKEATILIADRLPIDPAYLPLYKADCLIAVIPAECGGMGYPPPSPAPRNSPPGVPLVPPVAPAAPPVAPAAPPPPAALPPIT
jgi:hypothetical protein